jgi:single-stranded DNA-binding protein
MSAFVKVKGKVCNIKSFGKVLSFAIASSRKIKGEFHTDFFNVKILGEDKIKFFGHLVADKNRVEIDGSLVTSSWEKDGIKRNQVEIIVNEMKQGEQKIQDQPMIDSESIPF